MSDDISTSIKNMFSEVIGAPERVYDFEKILDDIVECVKDGEWVYYSFVEDKIKKETYIKVGHLYSSTLGESDFGVRVNYEREGKDIKNGNFEIAFEFGFAKYSFGNRSLVLKESAGKINGNINDYLQFFSDLPNEVFIAMGLIG